MFTSGDRLRYVRHNPENDTNLVVGTIYAVRYAMDDGWVVLRDDPNDPEGWDDVAYHPSCFEYEDPTNCVPHCIVELVKSVPKTKAK